MLSYKTFGDSDAPALLIVHGLYGSGRNWGVIAKRLSDIRHVITVDMRNHGASPHLPTHTYPDMADDLAEVIAAEGGQADIVGHSMGGKAAMALALTQPTLIRSLVIGDIAPVTYSHSQQPMIDAMRAVDLAQVTRRSDADAQLRAQGLAQGVASFLTQSLDVERMAWRLNLDALSEQMDAIIGFPEFDTRFDRPTLFLSGGQSDYVRPEHRSTIRALFPQARFAKLPGAGHWLHADDPRGFEASVRAWLDMASAR
ncbi:MAG: alpha/beta fold hydrolase [Pseudomonadota bacterium]